MFKAFITVVILGASAALVNGWTGYGDNMTGTEAVLLYSAFYALNILEKIAKSFKKKNWYE